MPIETPAIKQSKKNIKVTFKYQLEQQYVPKYIFRPEISNAGFYSVNYRDPKIIHEITETVDAIFVCIESLPGFTDALLWVKNE